MTNGQLRLIVALVPDASLNSRLTWLASACKGRSNRFRIGDRLRPHQTLYMTRFDEESVSAVVSTVEQLPVSLPTTGRAVGISVTANGYVEVSYEKTRNLLDLQESVVTALVSLRAKNDIQPESHLSESEIANLQEFGYEFVGDQYRPHITLAAFDPRSHIIVPPFDRRELQLAPAGLAILVADAAGAATSTIETFPF